MATKVRRKSVATTSAKESTPTVPFSPARHINVSLARTINLGNYESVKIGVSYSQNVEDDADINEVYENSFALLEEKLEVKMQEYEAGEEEEFDDEEDSGEYDEDDDESEEVDDDEEFDDEEEDDEEEDEEELTEDDIMKMKKSELVGLIEDEELQINPKLKLADLREAVIEELFEEEDDGGEEDDETDDEDWDDEDWDDED